MTDKEFKRLNRSQLIEIIYQFQLKQDELIAENERLSAALADKRLRIVQAGNIAEAALAINNVMQDAQNAAQQYLDEIRVMRDEVDGECRSIREKALEEAAAIVAKARKEAAALRTQKRKEVAAVDVPKEKPITVAAVVAPVERKKATAEVTVKREEKVISPKQPKAEDALLEEILSEFGTMSKL